MARASYLARREGRYYLQVRYGHVAATLLNRSAVTSAVSVVAYERERTDVIMGIEFGIIPGPQAALPTTETIKPIHRPSAHLIDLAVNKVGLTPLQPDASGSPRTKTPLSNARYEAFIAASNQTYLPAPS